MTRDETVRAWMTARDNAANWAKKERELRDFICANVWQYDAVAGNIDGTKHVDLGNGWDLKAVFGKTYSVKAGDDLNKALSAMRDVPVAAEKPVVLWKPAISTTGWNAAPQPIRAILSPVVTMKPTAPQLTIELKK